MWKENVKTLKCSSCMKLQTQDMNLLCRIKDPCFKHLFCVCSLFLSLHSSAACYLSPFRYTNRGHNQSLLPEWEVSPTVLSVWVAGCWWYSLFGRSKFHREQILIRLQQIVASCNYFATSVLTLSCYIIFFLIWFIWHIKYIYLYI